MADHFTRLTVSPQIPSDLLCGLTGHLLMAILDNVQDQGLIPGSTYFYTEEAPSTVVEITDDLVALVEAEPDNPASPFRRLQISDLENRIGDDLELDDVGLDFVSLFSILSAAYPDKLPRIEIEGAFTCSKARSGAFGGFAHVITPTKTSSMDTTRFIDSVKPVSSVANALQVVIDLATQNVLEPSSDPDEQNERNRQLEAIRQVEDLAVNQLGDD